jgi:hypothetical protein
VKEVLFLYCFQCGFGNLHVRVDATNWRCQNCHMLRSIVDVKQVIKRPHRHYFQGVRVYDEIEYECECGLTGYARNRCKICGKQDCEEHALCERCDEHTSSENPCDCDWRSQTATNCDWAKIGKA